MPKTKYAPGTEEGTGGATTDETDHGQSTDAQPAEYVSGGHLAELIGKPSHTPITDVFSPATARKVTRWHRTVDETYGADELEDLRAVPVEFIGAVLPEPPSRADVARWAADTGQRDPHELVADVTAAEAAARLAAEAEAATYPAASPAAVSLADVLDRHADLFGSSAELRHVARFARARGAGAWATLGNLLVRTVLAVPHPVTLPPIVGGPVSLNTLLAVAGVSGAGKDIAHAAAEAAVMLVHEGGAPLHWEPHPVGTGEGIGRTFAVGRKDVQTGQPATEFRCRSALFVVRDIAAIDALGERRGQTLVPELLKAAHGQELGHANATVEHRVILPPHSYRLGLSAGVQPGNGSSLLSERSIRDGLTQRFLWLPVRDGRRREAVREPDPLTVTVPRFGVTSDPLDDDTGPPALVHLDVAESIRREIVAVNDAKDADPFGRSGDPLAGHRLLAQLKAAAALALLHGHTSVDLENWQRGAALVAVSEAVTAGVAAESHEAAERDAAERGRVDGHRFAAADTARETVAVQEVAHRLAEFLSSQGDWTPQSALARLINAKRRTYIESALHLLTQRERIEVRSHEYQAGRFTTQFRAV